MNNDRADPMRCRNVKALNIPGCIGCAAGDHANCTCIGPTAIAAKRKAQVTTMWATGLLMKERGHSEPQILDELDRMLKDYNNRRREGSA